MCRGVHRIYRVWLVTCQKCMKEQESGSGHWRKKLWGNYWRWGISRLCWQRYWGWLEWVQVLTDSGLQAVVDNAQNDGASFDQFCLTMWQVLRTDYPTRIDLKSLKGEMLGDTGNPATYLHRQLKRWKQETERDPEGDPLMTTIFRSSVVEAMP
ncbi:hypothetical protein AAFF_G00299520 [Aldrovandia affinis]|uniref:Uncharacterized protein n=1 Tax=Aldrovandia affinis TaxID=143900 RepID=A0AAD7R910_9TELE|nr:hypothetical protein AAFF_G00299520 [Aldrovandia affinis]